MEKEKKKLVFSLWVAFAWVASLWLVIGMEWFFHWDLHGFGIYPRHTRGLIGILTAPFIHANARDHLLSNSLSLFPLAATLWYFYRPIALRVTVAIFLFSGFWIWIAARPSIHIGASGVIYGLAAFLFFSGIFRRDLVAMAVALVVVFFHGSMVWGTLPFFTAANVSWEAHLFGALAGALAAFFWRKEGRLSSKKYDWEEESEGHDDGFEYWDYRKMNPPPDGMNHPD